MKSLKLSAFLRSRKVFEGSSWCWISGLFHDVPPFADAAQQEENTFAKGALQSAAIFAKMRHDSSVFLDLKEAVMSAF